METFNLRLKDIQPSQLYISKVKYAAVERYFDTGSESQLEPIPIKELDGELVSTDGHTRGLAWAVRGYKEVTCVWEDYEMDWDAYRIFVQWCKEAGVRIMLDLQDRFLDNSEYELLWIGRCQKLERDLANSRKTK